MIGYERIESAVKERVIATFGVEPALCQQGDVDALFEEMQNVDAPLGFLLEFAGGTRLKQPPFNGKSWQWRVYGYALLRFQGDAAKIERDARNAMDKIITLFGGSPTLGGLTALATLSEIDQPLPSTINDVPFYWVPFTVDVLEKF